MGNEKTVEKTGAPSLRNSNIELLRILAMIGIIAHHLGYWGGFEYATDSLSLNQLWVQFIQIGGKIGVVLFIYISGYYLVKADEIRTAKVVKLWLQIFFYSLPVFLVLVLFGIRSFGIMDLIKNCFPVIFQKWWFATAYLLLYILSPFLNRLLKSLDEKQYIGFLLLTGICWCVIPTFTTQYFMGNELLFFVLIYSISGFIRLHKVKIQWSAAKCIVVSIILSILTFGSVVAFDILGSKFPFLAENALYLFIFQRSIMVVVIGLIIFIGFLKMNIGYKRVINFISPAMFGVFLIHENDCIRKWLWQDIFKLGSYSNSNVLIPYTILVVAIVFVGCTIIELLRRYSIELLSKPLIRFTSEKIDSASEKLKTFIQNKLKHDQNE